MADEPQFITVVRLIVEIIWTFVRITFELGRAFCKFCVPPEPKDVSDDIVLITGAGHGMGREVAVRLGKLGAKIVCVDINPKGNEETVKMIRKEKGTACNYECDVSNRAAVFELSEKVKKEVGAVTILINNAGIMPCRPLLKQTEKEIRTMMDINVNGVLWMIQAFLPTMIERNNGHIVSMSSMAGLMGLRNIVPYCGSKYAVRGIMEALYVELHQDKTKDTDGIKFTTICPSMVNTGLCHRPNIRFDKLMGMTEPDQAADQIVDAIRREYHEITIPSDLYYSNKLYRFIPFRAASIANDFIATGLDPHD